MRGNMIELGKMQTLTVLRIKDFGFRAEIFCTIDGSFAFRPDEFVEPRSIVAVVFTRRLPSVER